MENIFRASCCCSCGLCCSKKSLCTDCEIATLEANGLPKELANEIHGLSNKAPNHKNGFAFSELYHKINELGSRILNNKPL